MAKTPRISGTALKALVASTRAAPVRSLLARMLRGELGIDTVRALGEDARGELPMSARPVRARSEHGRASLGLGPLPLKGWPRPIAAQIDAFAAGSVTPRQLTERALAEARRLAERTPGMGPIHVYDDEGALRAAEEATLRYKEGRSLGPLDGVPVAIKEELAVRGLPTRLGTRYLPEQGETSDGTAVARLRSAGAVVLGHTPMTEFGMSPIGVNPHRPMPRNPHHEGHTAGGSSTGSAVAVSTGLVAVALGADGGGSIRIPASLTGVFGMKPTFGRISRKGSGLHNTFSHFGPIGASSADLALFIEACSGEDPDDEMTMGSPGLAAGGLCEALGRGVRGLRVGIDDNEWAAAEPEIARAGRAALDALEKEGAILCPLGLKLARHASAIGYLGLGLEALAGLREARARLPELSMDLQVTLATLEAFASDDYLDGQRLRAGLRRELALVLRNVDVLALPTTACTAPAVSDSEARGGFLDPPVLDRLCRFAFLANLTGLPAGTAPIATDAKGLPFGLQIVGDAWDEAAVLQVLSHLERTGVATVVRPKVSVELLGAR